MPTVTIDAADLEALLFSTGAIKDIEAALVARERDPLARSAIHRLTGAHDRIAAAWRRANRAEPEAPTDADIAKLRAMFTDSEGERIAVATVKTYPQRLAQTLLLVEAGPMQHGVKIDWPAPSAPEFRADMHNLYDLSWAVRLTPRGQAALGAPEPVTVVSIGTSDGDYSHHNQLLAQSMRKM